MYNVYNNVIMRGTTIVVPESLNNQYMPANERADCARDIEVIGGSTPIERVLGI